MAFSNNNGDLMSDINVTPLVDVMLVLLIIFMVAAPMMTQGVDVDLPETTAAALPTESEHLIITINKDNEIFINDFQLGVDGLRDKLMAILKGQKEREVFLRADKTIPYGIVAQVMAEIQGAGVEKLGMVTEAAPEGDSTERDELKKQ